MKITEYIKAISNSVTAVEGTINNQINTHLSVPAAYHIYNGQVSLSNSVATTGFSTTLYTGNGTSQSITTGVDMDTQWGNDASEKFGGLVWAKSRSNTIDNLLFDTIRTSAYYVSSNTTNAQINSTTNITSFNNSGFSLGANAGLNTNLATYSSWNFQTTHRKSSCDGASELIVNGNFDTNLNGWTVGAGVSAQWVAGKAEITWLNTTSTYCMYQAINTVIGKKYTVKITSSQSVGADNLYIKVGNSANDGTVLSLIQAVGVEHLVTFTAVGTVTYLSLFFGENIGDKGYIDNVSIKECIYPTNHGKYWECHYNPYTGFTIVKFEGSGLAGHEIPHMLGRKLVMEFIKCLGLTTNWEAHVLDKYLIPNLTDAGVNYNYTITDSYSIQGVNSSTNVVNRPHILYGWANSYFDEKNTLIGNYEIGVYQGTGVADNKITTRGKPAWVMVKRLDGAASWCIQDNQRNNGLARLLVNDSAIENTTYGVSFSSDGFIIAGSSITDGAWNASGGQYLYMVVYDNDSGSGKSKYPKATDTSTLNLNAHVPFANGIDTTGNKVSIAYKNETITLSNALTQGKNYIALLNDGSYVASPYEPMYLMRDRSKAGENPDYFDANAQKWYSTTGGSELVTNGTFDTTTAGWTATNATLSIDNARIKVTTTTTSLGIASQSIATTVGKTYRIKLGVYGGNQAAYWSVGTNVGGTDNIPYQASVASGSFVSYNLEFVATSTTTYINLAANNGAIGYTALFDNISCFEVTPTVGTAITPRNYLDCVVYADQNGQPEYVEQLEKVQYFDAVKANDFRGKNACTAIVEMDYATIPPTIKSAYNVSAVIKNGTPVGRVYFSERMDNLNYSIKGTAGANNGTVTGLIFEAPVNGVKTLDYFEFALITHSGSLAISPNVSISVIGGKN